MSEMRPQAPTNPAPTEQVQGTTAGGTGDQALAQTITAGVLAGVTPIFDRIAKFLDVVETRVKQTTIDDDIAVEAADIGVGDPYDRAERQRNSRDRNDFYRDALQAVTVGFMRTVAAREADRYSASEPSPLPINRRAAGA